MANLRTGKIRFIANFYEWSVSPDGRYMVCGNETNGMDHKYKVALVPLNGGKRRELMTVSFTEPPFGASFKWSSDSSLVTVATDRDEDERDEISVFEVAPRSSIKPASLPVKP